MNADYHKRLLCYRTSMSLAQEMLSEGTITVKEYEVIDRIIAKKYSLSLGSLYCHKPLIEGTFRGNIRHTEGGLINGTNS